MEATSGRKRVALPMGGHHSRKTNHIDIIVLENVQTFGEKIGAMFVTFWASLGLGVAGNGFSANNNQCKGRDSDPCPGDPFRGHFSFLKVTHKKR